MNAAHSHAPMSTSTVISQTVAIGGSPSITPSRMTTSTTAVRTRCLSTVGGLDRLVALLIPGQAEASLPSGERIQRRFEMRHGEIRPQHLAHVDFRIGEIPKEEIADAMIATGADEKIRIGYIAKRQGGREACFVDFFDAQRATRSFGGQLACRPQDVPAPALTDRHLQLESRVTRRELFTRGHALLQPDAEAVAITDETKPHTIAIQLVDLCINGIEEQLHDVAHLGGRALPVFAREREYRERTNLAART